jgi:hypothetical protein
MTCRLKLHCVSNCRYKNGDSNNITYYNTLFHYRFADSRQSFMFILSESNLCVQMVPIIVSSTRVLLKCSEQLVECLLIQPSTTNTIMTLISAPV